ncbi:MAG: DUF1800 domain-containing protein [Acidimicrobiaceae bacterium]|nr:DUF1800 domain-containing protein [Acidimicrobiaceae bacterium]
MDMLSALALLYRRAGFGATPTELAQAAALGYNGMVNKLVSGLQQPDSGADAIPTPTLLQPPFYKPGALNTPEARQAFYKTLSDERTAITNWWIMRMVATNNPLREKLTFFLHCHFPTAISKVIYPVYMYRQNQIFRSFGSGDFTQLTTAVSTDPAMLIWLDAGTDRLPDPNENFARELMERFTMGIGSYSEYDVRAAAFAFTGWHLNNQTGEFAIAPRLHSNLPQTFLGHQGVTTGQEVINIVTNSEPSAKFVVASVWSRFAYPIKPTDPLVAELASAYAKDRNMANLLRAVFRHPNFLSAGSASGLIKQPVEYVIGALRALRVSPARIPPSKPPLSSVLNSLGQVLFDPPSVGGWPQNEYWLSTSSALARWRFAHWLSLAGDISPVADSPVASRVDAVSEMLSIQSWSSSSGSTLKDAVANPHTLVSMALVSPEYVAN